MNYFEESLKLHEEKLKKLVNIPVFHDDQHGTAIVVLAGVINALKVVDKKLEDAKVVVNATGAAGTAIAKLLLSSGVKNLIACDKVGILYRGMDKIDLILFRRQFFIMIYN